MDFITRKFLNSKEQLEQAVYLSLKLTEIEEMVIIYSLKLYALKLYIDELNAH